jgi:osmoprotectant transport system permease protein
MNLWQFMLQNHTEVLELTLEHLWLVGISTLLAVLVGIPLGILITRTPASGEWTPPWLKPDEAWA